MSDVLSLVVSVCVLISSMIVRPARAQCPAEWELSGGVDARGLFLCRPARIGCDYADRICEQPPGFIAGRIYCGPGFDPVQARWGDGARCSRQPRM